MARPIWILFFVVPHIPVERQFQPVAPVYLRVVPQQALRLGDVGSTAFDRAGIGRCHFIGAGVAKIPACFFDELFDGDLLFGSEVEYL